MAGDYVPPPEFRTTYAYNACRLLTEHGCASPEVIRRIHTMAQAFDYCAAEWEIWGTLVQRIDHIRSGGHWGPENLAWLREQSDAALKPPMSPPPTEVHIAAVRALLGALVDELGSEVVAVALDQTIESRRP